MVCAGKEKMMLGDREWTKLLLLTLLQILPPCNALSASGSGSGNEPRLTECMECSQTAASCTVYAVNRTIECEVDTISCRPTYCENGRFCQLSFQYYMNSWLFDSVCFLETEEDICHLDPFELPGNDVWPPHFLFCQCSGIDKCGGSHVYVHPDPSPLPPSPSPSLMINDTDNNSQSVSPFILLAVIIIFIILVVVAVVMVVFCVRRAMAAKRRRILLNLRSGGGIAFQNFSGEQDLPFQLVHLISQGRFGYVYRTSYEGELVAVKIFTYQNRFSWENERSLFEMESTKHRNVIDYIVSGSWGSGYQLQMFIVTPFYPLGSLNRFLARNTVSWEQTCRVIHSISNGLSHLHSESYVNSSGVMTDKYAVAHRDVKSANVLVRGENGDCVLADLGFALILDPSRDEKDMANTGQVGTYRFMAPEVLDARVNLHSTQAFKQIDIYALALVMWEVVWRCNVQEEETPRDYLMAYEDMVGQRPGIDTMREVVCTQKLRPQIPPAWRDHPGLSSLVDTIAECWDQDPEARLSAINVTLRLKELLDGRPTDLVSEHTPSHIFSHTNVVPGNERFRRSQAQESTADTIGTTDSRPPPYDNRWGYPGNNGGDNSSNDRSPSGSVELNFHETTI